MRWEIINTTPTLGDTRFVTKFAWLPIVVLNKITNTDHRIWLEPYKEEQKYTPAYWDGTYGYWKAIAKTIDI
jgi:hypothetical protein